MSGTIEPCLLDADREQLEHSAPCDETKTGTIGKDTNDYLLQLIVVIFMIIHSRRWLLDLGLIIF